MTHMGDTHVEIVYSGNLTKWSGKIYSVQGICQNMHLLKYTFKVFKKFVSTTTASDRIRLPQVKFHPVYSKNKYVKIVTF